MNMEQRKFLISFIPLFVIFLTLFVNCSALYEDQIGKFDWRQQYVGKIRYAHVDSTSGAQQILVASDDNVIASLNVKTGALEWRHVLEKGDSGNVNALSTEAELLSVTGNGLFLRSWDSNNGVLNWETSLPNLEAADENLSRFYISSTKKEIFSVQIKPKTSVQATIYRVSEANAKTSPQISAPWIQASTSCAFASNSYFVCIVQSSKTLQLLYLNNGVSFVAVPLKFLGLQTNSMNTELKVKSLPFQDVSAQPMFAVYLGNDGILLGKVEASGVKVVKVLPQAVDVTTILVDEKLTIFAIVKNEEQYKILAIDPLDGSEVFDLAGSFSLTENYGKIESTHILPYSKKDGSLSYKIFLIMEDHALHLIHQHGKILWTREEALASIISTEFLDLPLSENDAKIEEEFGAADANILSMLLTRITTQLIQIQSFFLKTISSIQGHVDTSEVRSGNLVRDRFGLHKVIVAATKAGKLFGIDSLNGDIIWKKFVPNIAPVIISEKPNYFLFVQRTTAHFPHQPLCSLLGKTKESGESFVHSFNPITGVDLSSHKFSFSAIQTMILPEMDKNYMKGLVLVDPQLKAHVYPSESEEILLKTKTTNFIILANTSSGILAGYSFALSSANDLKITEVWRISLPVEQQQITQIKLKRITEHVHSQGRVMGDRSVLYKYLNPNLAVVVTEGSDPINKYLLNVFLVDGITGLIVYASSHKRSRGPIHIVHSENWIIYSYYNEKSRRMELSSIELYEGKSQSNTTAFSSLSPPALPLVEHLSFILPAGVDAMTDTVTEKGITNKHVLIALPLGGIVELPKAFVDPRRPIHPLPEHREEGLIPYLPELPISSEGIINYNQSVFNIRSIQTAPAGLESTCLVFAYGLDLFYTRVTPSKTFDILKDDFDHLLITAVLIALLMFSYATRRLAARKALRAAWK